MGSQVAIVTGSSRGIGRGIAVALGAHGWTVVINYRSNQEAADETKHLVEEAGGTGFVVRADISIRADLDALVDATLAEYGRIDLLVNNAGVGPRKRVDMLEVDEESYDEVMHINLKGAFFLTQRVANEMIRLLVKTPMPERIVSAPKIISISSISAYASSPTRAEYCISKAGMSMMTSLFADRLAEYGINVYEIQPGIIQTDMTRVVSEKYDKLFAEGVTPIRRWGQPEDVAKAVLAVALDYLPYSTGEIINVDGGFHIHRL